VCLVQIDVSVNAPTAGKIVEHLAAEEDTVTVGQDLFRIEPGEGGESESKPAESKSEQPQHEEETPAPPTPAKEDVQKKDELGVQEGKEKKELKETTKPKQEPEPKQPSKESNKESKAKEEPAPPRVAGSRNETRVKMNRMRLRIAERLKESQNAAASLTTFNEIDMSALMEMRKKYKDEILKEHDVKLGYMSAFAKASCLALKEITAANASIEGQEIVYRDYVDLSVAVATPKGLVTPVVRNADSMTMIEIEREIAALGKKVCYLIMFLI
jgi:2-oxoglutarate dehydrogenase E2 component (dihydrolipoamide succinyltransferase)